MSISVVIPTKDRRKFLEKVLMTYFSQKEVDEVIVVIDGSTDGTQEYLEDLRKTESKLRVIDNGINRGIPFTKNRGIDAAKSEYIFIAEDDLELTTNFFSTLLAHNEDIGADILCGRNIFRYDYETAEEAIARTDKFRGEYINKKTIEINTSLNIGKDMITTMIAAPMLGKAEAFKQVRFDERYKVNFWREETDFQISAQEYGYKLGSCPHAICFNYMIRNDRSGVHSAVGPKRARWMTINNWYFIKKHRIFIEQNFEIGNSYLYILKFSIKYLIAETTSAILVSAKSFALRQLSHLRTRK